MKHLIVLVGMPGAGKDTQADLLENKLGYSIIRTGDMVRKLAQNNPLIDSEQHSGKLAEPEMVDAMVSDAIRETKIDTKIVCDGYPRTVAQAKKLHDICIQEKIQFDKVIYIQIPVEEVIKRLTLRDREDDTAQGIQKRLEVFESSVRSVLDYYAQNNFLVTIDGVGEIETIHQRIKKALSV